jgi:hypothetical protein
MVDLTDNNSTQLVNGEGVTSGMVVEQQQIVQQYPPLLDMDLEKDFMDDIAKIVHNANIWSVVSCKSFCQGLNIIPQPLCNCCTDICTKDNRPRSHACFIHYLFRLSSLEIPLFMSGSTFVPAGVSSCSLLSD